MKAFSTACKQIVGTKEILEGTAFIDPESFEYYSDPTEPLSFAYIGETHVDFTSCCTERRRNTRIFVDADGNDVPENEILLADDLSDLPQLSKALEVREFAQALAAWKNAVAAGTTNMGLEEFTKATRPVIAGAGFTARLKETPEATTGDDACISP